MPETGVASSVVFRRWRRASVTAYLPASALTSFKDSFLVADLQFFFICLLFFVIISDCTRQINYIHIGSNSGWRRGTEMKMEGKKTPVLQFHQCVLEFNTSLKSYIKQPLFCRELRYAVMQLPEHHNEVKNGFCYMMSKMVCEWKGHSFDKKEGLKSNAFEMQWVHLQVLFVESHSCTNCTSELLLKKKKI